MQSVDIDPRVCHRCILRCKEENMEGTNRTCWVEKIKGWHMKKFDKNQFRSAYGAWQQISILRFHN